MSASTPTHANASAVIDTLYQSGSERPNIRDRNRPVWFYELSARASLLIGDAPIRFATHSFDDSVEQDGQAWLFTDDIVVIATLKGNDNSFELEVQAVGRATLTSLVVNRIADPFNDYPGWPDDIAVTVEYASRQSATLPLAHSYQRTELAELVPSLARDPQPTSVTFALR